MCFTLKKNNKRAKEPVSLFLKDVASDGIRSMQTSIYCNKTLPNAREWTLIGCIVDFHGSPCLLILLFTFLLTS